MHFFYIMNSATTQKCDSIQNLCSAHEIDSTCVLRMKLIQLVLRDFLFFLKLIQVFQLVLCACKLIQLVLRMKLIQLVLRMKLIQVFNLCSAHES